MNCKAEQQQHERVCVLHRIVCDVRGCVSYLVTKPFVVASKCISRECVQVFA